MKTAPIIAATFWLTSALPAANAPATPREFERAGALCNETIATPALDSRAGYTLHFSVSPPDAFSEDTRVVVSLSQAATTLVTKTLHAGDPEILAMFHAAVTGPARLRVAVESPLARPARFHLEVVRRVPRRDPARPAAGTPVARLSFPVSGD